MTYSFQLDKRTWKQKLSQSNFFVGFQTARQILRRLLRGQISQGLTQQKNPAKNPATLQEPRKDGQRSWFLLIEIWPAVRSQMPETCASRALGPPTALWPNILSVPQSLFFTFRDFYNLKPKQGSLWGSLPKCSRGRTPQGLTVTLQKTPKNKASSTLTTSIIHDLKPEPTEYIRQFN